MLGSVSNRKSPRDDGYVNRRTLLSLTGGFLTVTAGCLFSATQDDLPSTSGEDHTTSPGTGDGRNSSECTNRIALQSRSDASAWPQFGATAANASHVPGATITDSPAVIWARIEGIDYYPPVVAESLVAADAGANAVRGADPASGELQWEADALGTVRWPPVLGDDVVLTVAADDSDDRFLYALDPASGADLWNVPVPAAATGMAPTVRDGVAYVSSRGSVHAVRVDSGERVWTADLPPTPGWTTPAVIDDSIYTHNPWHRSGERRTVAAIRRDGTVRWTNHLQLPDGWWLRGEVVGDGERLYVAAHELENALRDSPTPGPEQPPVGRIFVLDARTGSVTEELPLAGRIHQSPAVADGILFVGTAGPGDRGGQVLAYDVAAGCVRWRDTSDEGPVKTPAVTKRSVLISDGDRLTALDVADGSRTWRLEFDGHISKPIVADRTVYLVESIPNADRERLVAVREA